MSASRTVLATLLFGAVALVPACAAEPGPEPTGFATEDQAFEAARETYEAYVDALNDADPADPATLERMYSWLSQDALAAARVEFTQMSADGWQKSGDATIRSISPVSYESDSSRVVSEVCLDVSGVDVVDPVGVSVIADDRLDLQPMTLEFHESQSSTGLSIALIVGREADPKCA